MCGVIHFVASSGATVAVAMLGIAVPSAAQVQTATPASMGKDEITALAKVHVAISVAQDSIDAQLAQSRNKTLAAQQGLRDKFRGQVEEILHHSGMTEADYSRKTFLISSDTTARRAFDAIVAQLTGVPTPGQVAAPTRRCPSLRVRSAFTLATS